jgi:hypothetical protein
MSERDEFAKAIEDSYQLYMKYLEIKFKHEQDIEM